MLNHVLSTWMIFKKNCPIFRKNEELEDDFDIECLQEEV
jgi:hypothetical protein